MIKLAGSRVGGVRRSEGLVAMQASLSVEVTDQTKYRIPSPSERLSTGIVALMSRGGLVLHSVFFFFFFFTLVTGPRRALSLMLSDTRVYEPEIRTRLGTLGPHTWLP